MRLAIPFLALGLVACSSGSSTPVSGIPQEAQPDFALLDVNPTSPTHDTPVSPRDHLGFASAWYFGSAT